MLSILASRSGERYEASFADHRWKRVEVARRFPEVRELWGKHVHARDARRSARLIAGVAWLSP
jgi:hypothetical protein